MYKFEFHNPVKIIFGPGEVSRAGAEAARLGKKAMIVSYREHDFFADLLGRIQEMLAAESVASVAFCEVTANPEIGQCRRGVELARAEGVDLVIGVGGGSAMDAAKIIAAGAKYDGDIWDMVVSRHDDVTAVFPEDALPMLMIPTLPATGSEMNCCAVVTNEATTEKSYAWGAGLFPKVSIVDPQLTCSLPAYQTACGAADTISHVMEFYINGRKNAPLNARIQEAIILTVMENAPKVLTDPNDLPARGELQWASIVALNGWSQPGDAWTPMHQIGHVLSARHGVTHGESLAIVMPAWMRHMNARSPDRYVQFAGRIFGIDADDKDPQAVAAEAIDKFEAFLNEIGVQTKLSGVGITPDNVEGIEADVVRISFGAGGKLAGRPPIDRDDLRKILELAR